MLGPRVLSAFSSSCAPKRLAENFALASRPFIITASDTALRLGDYCLPSLQTRRGNELFEVGKNARTHEPYLMELNVFVAGESPEYYLFDSSYQQQQQGALEVEEEEQQHELFRFESTGDLIHLLPRAHRPEQSWLVIGHAGSGSFLHTDPLRTSACNELVSGEKKWLIVSPSLANDDDDDEEQEEEEEEEEQAMTEQQDGNGKWFHDLVLRVKRQQQQQQQQGSPRKRDVYLFTQRKGQVVFVPAGFKHAVLNTTLSVALTHNFLLSFDPNAQEGEGEGRRGVCVEEKRRRELVASLEAHKKINTLSERNACLAALGCFPPSSSSFSSSSSS